MPNMRGKLIQIVKPLDLEKDYYSTQRKVISKRRTVLKLDSNSKVRQVLGELETGKQYLLNDLVLKYNKIFDDPNIMVTRNVFKYVMKKGKEIGMIKEIQVESLTFEQYCELESVAYMRSQLKQTKVKHQESKTKHTGGGCKRAYSLQTWHFNSWLHGQEITVKQNIPTGANTFEIKRVVKKLDTIEDLLEIRKQTNSDDPDIIKFIKKFLYDDCHSHKSIGYMINYYCSIASYFAKNEYKIEFDYDASVKHSNPSELLSGEQLMLSLTDLKTLLDEGESTITDRATVLCKFHGGLDNITLTDRFNFEGWPQLVKWFGTEDYEKWDLSLCPAIVKLVRIKVAFEYNSMYDIDAIQALQKALKLREEKTGKKMKDGEAMLLNTKLEPLTDRWVSDLVPKLAERAKNQRIFKILSGYVKEKRSHELRDLLKSTLKVCGTHDYVADHSIGHKPKDSYDKEHILYPKKMREEFMKASKTINIFSKISNYIEDDLVSDNDLLTKKNEEMQKTITSHAAILAKLTNSPEIQSSFHESFLSEQSPDEKMKKMIEDILKDHGFISKNL